MWKTALYKRLVRSWLLGHGAPVPSQALLQAAAEFLLWQLENGLDESWEHRLATHAALVAAGLVEQAQRVVLGWIVNQLSLAGMYRVLLDDWLPPLMKADNPQIRGRALNQIGKQYLHIGDYDSALKFLQQAHPIMKQIGDVTGLCTTLFNMGHIHLQKEEMMEAVQAWVTVYGIAKKINRANILQALENLAGNIGLKGGLQGWEQLAQQLGDTGDD